MKFSKEAITPEALAAAAAAREAEAIAKAKEENEQNARTAKVMSVLTSAPGVADALEDIEVSPFWHKLYDKIGTIYIGDRYGSRFSRGDAQKLPTWETIRALASAFPGVPLFDCKGTYRSTLTREYVASSEKVWEDYREWQRPIVPLEVRVDFESHGISQVSWTVDLPDIGRVELCVFLPHSGFPAASGRPVYYGGHGHLLRWECVLTPPYHTDLLLPDDRTSSPRVIAYSGGSPERLPDLVHIFTTPGPDDDVTTLEVVDAIIASQAQSKDSEQ